MTDPFQMLWELSSRFPIQLKILFSLRKIGHVKEFLNSNVLSKEELARAAYSASTEGYQHELRNVEHLPAHLAEEKKTLRERLQNSDIKKSIGTISSIFEQRKMVITHLFQRGTEWHVIYFTLKDIDSSGKNHWKFGPHVHYVNYLWRNYDPLQIWNTLGEKKYGSVGEHYPWIDHRKMG